MLGKRKAYSAATLVAIIIGLSFMFVKISLLFASPLDALAHRFTVAFIAVTLVFLIKKESIKFSKRNILRMAFLAISYPLLFFGFQVFGLVYTTSSEAGIVQATVPIFTLIFSSVLLKETSTIGQKVAITFSVLGVMYMVFMNGIDGKAMMLLGMGLILFSTISQSLYQVLARKLTQDYSLLTITFYLTFCGFIIFNGFSLTNHLINGTFSEFISPFGHLNYIFALLYLGVLSTLVTSYLSTYSLSILPAFQMSVFGNLTTVITIGTGIIFLGESFFYYHITGAVLIILGIFGVNYFGQKKERNSELEKVAQSMSIKA
ncbi:DMT family transporter [Halalkalibacter sp. APA_J-10(15)]|uniref:DMT family transporter n=1 Tax=Halalkalibacter sp. APA_J-10(15) TaxID=2933805 RepID=UPI001FF50754|nr:DMT family transporter [Halalkalibacter sp. APA_J-10(15)]MCK0473973.1 DMT family transporter [Halalkalibacter sp. APA_J-10(15)]